MESALGARLPDDIASLLKSFGAGSPKRDYYFSRVNDTEVSIGYVLPLTTKGKVAGLLTSSAPYRERQELSANLIPFALDNGHANFLCVRLSERDVVYWLHDDPDHRIRIVAASLKDFLSGRANHLSERPP